MIRKPNLQCHKAEEEGKVATVGTCSATLGSGSLGVCNALWNARGTTCRRRTGDSAS
jgi:hypothetical protein